MEIQLKFDHWYERMFEDEGYNTPKKKMELINKLKKHKNGNSNKSDNSSSRNLRNCS